ncbi:hypothetical protein GYH30_025044 [Glycine max]|uniref:Uncharacterized protein n=2 Tax=Glycine subgen. Soja TaxID=1462606 RepID=K7LDX0_SOYBN|nr:hypothetical protein JHK87_025080 [Glycine soja]KAH1043019.1 hypothetical protein GYH30_025044 [Glycine max]RZB92037.1 Protein COFACTOR ASSEMBLY OF COMPLEX C SUBUNIT B CCB4, chloroplastic [Glycine soja]
MTVDVILTWLFHTYIDIVLYVDLLTLGLAVTNILAGLVWLSIKAKSITMVNPRGVECKRLCTTLPEVARNELLW